MTRLSRDPVFAGKPKPSAGKYIDVRELADNPHDGSTGRRWATAALSSLRCCSFKSSLLLRGS